MLRNIGHALGAHGFVNIACVRELAAEKRYISVADMRATTWVDYNRYLGEDHAVAIRGYFDKGNLQIPPSPCNPEYPPTLRIPYIFWLTPWQFLTNSHRVWSFREGFTTREIVRYCVSCVVGVVVSKVRVFLKSRLKPVRWNQLRSIWRAYKLYGRRYV